MDSIITNALMSFGAGFSAAAVSKAQGPAQALDDIMTIVGFEKLHAVAEKKRAKRELDVQLYKESIAQRIAKIPEKDLQDPQMSIVGPALEASKFYIEENELREMFSKLIASSMNKQDNEIIHSSYVEIIKQLSPLDAQNLYYLNKGPNEVANIRLTFENGSFVTVIQNLYLGNPTNQDNNLISPSLINLQRLGLITIIYGTYSFDDSAYDSLRNSKEYLQYEGLIKDIQISKNAIKNQIIPANSIGNFIEYKSIHLEKGLATLTSYGENFCKICLPD